MELLRELIQIQRERGYLHEDQLRAMSAARGVPLYHLEGLVSFYPAFRRTPPPGTTIEVCRDVICAMAGGSQRCRELMARWDDSDGVEIQEVSCLGRCDSAPAGAISHVPVAPANLIDAVQLEDSQETVSYTHLTLQTRALE